MTTTIIAMMFATTLLYENDFATRRSEEAPPSSVWATYEYDKGGPVAYDFDRTDSFNRYTGMYPWGDKTSTYSQQDGWIKKDWGTGSRYTNCGHTSITDESDPAIVYSAKDLTQPATNQGAIVLHSLRNVFTNGVVRAQFDLRQPDSAENGKKWSWFRLMSEYSMKSDNTNGDQFPLEVGVSGSGISGAWRDAGQPDGTRNYHGLGVSVQALHWYRYVVTCNLDTQTSDFQVYDLGLSRIPMDETPLGSVIASRTGLLFRKNITAETGGISGIAIRFSYTDTGAWYGETGFNADAAYMYDNIKVSWKPTGATSFTDCYRNDFSKSMRRTIDGSGELVHNYVQTEADETSTFTYGSELIHKAGDFTWKGKPFLPAAFGTANTVQDPGVDGWRFAGRSGFTGPVTLTTNGANRLCFISSSCQCLQPMCEDITNGLVKMEMDMRMPRGWNISNNGYTTLFLTSNKGYDEENYFNYYTLVRLGLSSTNGGGNSTTPVETYSVVNSSESTLNASYNTSWAEKFKALEWYRLQLFIDMDKTNYWFYVYDLGTSVPANPDTFNSSNPVNALVAGTTNRLFSAAITKFGLGIGAYGVLNWNEPKKNGSFNGDYAMYFDNVRLWKGNGGGGWNLVFKNDFSTTVRNIRRKSVKLSKTSYIDRPEYGEDGWSTMPQYNVSPRVAGENPAMYSGDDYISIVHPIGGLVKSGRLHAQYDVRLPVFWPSSPNYFRFQLGNGAMASASTWRTPAYRAGTHRTVRTDFQMNSTADSTTGVKNQTDIVVQDGNGTGGDGASLKQQLGNSYVGHWIRVKIDADMQEKTWACSAYDMGKTQPTLSTADGTLLKSWSGLHFNFNDPITHLYFMTGRTTSFAPWRSDMPGALLVDNIRISHEKPGTVIIVK